jgi:hypothetical protein
MSIRSFSNSSIKTGEKRSKFWDQNTVILYPAFESIASATPSGSSVSFTSIPSTYTHLQIRYLARDNASGTLRDMNLRFNNDTGSNYAFHFLRGSGSVVGISGAASFSSIQANDVLTGATSTANIYGVGIIDIHDYASTTKNTTVRWFSGNDQNGSGYASLSSGLYINTAAVDRIDITQNFAAGTIFALYGIKEAA